MSRKTGFTSQAKVLTGGGGLREAQFDAPCLLAFLRLTALLGSITDTLTLAGEHTYVNDFETRLRALPDLAKD